MKLTFAADGHDERIHRTVINRVDQRVAAARGAKVISEFQVHHIAPTYPAFLIGHAIVAVELTAGENDLIRHGCFSLRLINSKNSMRVAALRRNCPRMAEVTITLPGFLMPRIVMHRWAASTTTATPWGRKAFIIVSAIWLVKRSCSCGRRARSSTTRAI